MEKFAQLQSVPRAVCAAAPVPKSILPPLTEVRIRRALARSDATSPIAGLTGDGAGKSPPRPYSPVAEPAEPITTKVCTAAKTMASRKATPIEASV
ncbi:hypothetical protein GCM10011503_01890 [Henriciella pelagia]|uniref:Uncharacterized protein n=1 Tax=Henriciella pelagia TaxID=1977912 RepID=A0ABQ1J4D4_9PROT|nr:hypothetical protein GCM10011503_01890 [Henriciella pelagia]